MSVGLPLVSSQAQPKRATILPFSDDINDQKKFTPKLPSLVASAIGPEPSQNVKNGSKTKIKSKPFPRAEAMGLSRTTSANNAQTPMSPMRIASSNNTKSISTLSLFSAWIGAALRIDSEAVLEFLEPILTKKTAFALCWIVCCAVWNSTCQALVDHWTFFNEFHVADTQFSDPANRRPLPDLGFHLLPHVTTPHIADHWNAFMIVPTFVVMFPALGSFRARALQRFCLIQGLCFLLRSFSILMTNLPNPYQSCTLNPARDEHFILEGLKVMGGKRFTCGDVMYSGHSVNMTLMNMIWQQYLPTSWAISPYLHVFWWVMNIGGLLCCVATHFHYSVDCYLGFVVAFSIWTIYHLAVKVPRSHDGPEESALGWLNPVKVFLWIEDDLDDHGLLAHRSASKTSDPLDETVCGKSLEENDEKVNVELHKLLDTCYLEDTWQQDPQVAG